MTLQRSLSKRTMALISQGAKTVGFKDAFFYIEESLQMKEAESVRQFCNWLHENLFRASMEMPFVESNYSNLYQNYFLKNC
jgi:hypothetical protein